MEEFMKVRGKMENNTGMVDIVAKIMRRSTGTGKMERELGG